MEIADNQHHPIDLSRKCAYYDQPQRYASRSTAVTSSRPLPDLIPISLLHNATASSKPRKDAASPLLDCVQSCNQSLLGFQFKERSTSRKELSRQRSISRPSSASASSGSKMRKSASETGLPFMRTDGAASRTTASTNYLSVPMYRSVAAAATSSVSRPAKYADHDGGRVYVSDLITARRSAARVLTSLCVSGRRRRRLARSQWLGDLSRRNRSFRSTTLARLARPT